MSNLSPAPAAIRTVASLGVVAGTSPERWNGWRFVLVSFLCLIVGLPIAAGFSVGYIFDFVELPGTIMAVVVAGVCAAGFVLCPRKPVFPKVATFLLFLSAAQCAVDFVGYYYIFIQTWRGG